MALIENRLIIGISQSAPDGWPVPKGRTAPHLRRARCNRVMTSLCPCAAASPPDADSQIRHLPRTDRGSALLGLRRGRKITEQEADAAVASYRAFPIDRQDVIPLWPRIQRLHFNLSACDAQYVALAEVLGVSLVTADPRIAGSGAARCDIEVFGAPPSS